MDNSAAAFLEPVTLPSVHITLPVALVVQRYGGTASWTVLRQHVTQHALRRALDRGEVQRVARGRYALPALPPARLAAARRAGVVSHLSAATEHRLPLLLPPLNASLTVAPNSRTRQEDTVTLHWRPLRERDVVDGVTTPLRTVLDCAAGLPFGEALAVADGALRLTLVRPDELLRAATLWRGRGARAVRRVAEHADARAANPFESALRAIALDAGCTGFEPQVHVDVAGTARVDLGDVGNRVVLEADSFEWHGERRALRRDCRRYDELVRAGWRVLRFAWEDVMFDPAWVGVVTADVVRGGRGGRTRTGRCQKSTVAKVPTREKPTRS